MARPEAPSAGGDAQLAAEVQSQLRAAHLGGGGRGAGAGLDPFDPSALASGAAGAVQRLKPGEVGVTDPLALLDTVKDGRVSLEVPLKPGTYTFSGHDIEVKPGTKARVEAEIKDGRIVPRGEGQGGTRVTVNPPIDGPLWLTGKGAYVERDGRNGGKLVADIGGFFDQSVKKVGDLGLGGVVRELAGGGGAAAAPRAGEAKKPARSGDSKPTDLLDTSAIRFNVANVQLKDNAVDLGGARLDLAPGNELSISGTGQRAELRGRVRTDSLRVQQDGLTLDAGRGAADLSVTAEKRAGGGYDVRAQVTGLDAEVRSLEAKSQGAEGDRLGLKDARLQGGSIDVRMRVGGDGAALSQVSAKGRFSGTAEGQLSVKDADGDAKLAFSTGRAEGSFDVNGARTQVDAQLSGASVSVTGLDTKSGAASLKLEHARAQGDVALSVDTGTKRFSADVNATSVDVSIADYKGRTEGVSADLGRTEVTGNGKLQLGSDGGLSVEGDLRVNGVIDDLKVNGEQGQPARFDVAQGSEVQGRLRRLSVKEGLELDASANVNLGLEGYQVKLPGVEAKGSATLAGNADLKVSGQGVEVNGEATATVRVDEGKVAPGGDKLSLDVGRGSELTLALKQASYSSGAGGVQVQLGKGSHLEATLSGGHVKAGGYDVDVEPGSRARFDIDSVTANGAGQAALRGRLEVDVGARVSGGDGSRVGSVEAHAQARGKVVIDDVTMSSDGRLEARGIDVEVDARIDRVTALSKGTASLGGGRASGAAAGSAPQAGAAGGAPAPAATGPVAAAADVPSPEGVRSPDEVRAASASELAGVPPASASFDPLAVARQVRDGKLELTVPLEGRVGKGIASVRFEPGTELKLTAEVKDGKIVGDQLKAELNKPGDGPLWVTVKGAYLDDKDKLRLDLGGMYDFAVADLSGDGPPTVGRLVDQIGAKAGGGASSSGRAGSAAKAGGGASSPVDLSRASVKLEGARFQDGALELPIGTLHVDGDTRLSLEGTAERAVLSGHVNLERLDVRGEELAFKNARGDADLRVEIDNRGEAPSAKATLSNLDLSVEEAAFKKGSDYVHMGDLRVQGGQVELSGSLVDGTPKVEVNARLSNVEAEIQSARLLGEDDKPGHVEVGRTRFAGELELGAGGLVGLKGRVEELDAGLRGIEVKTPEGAVALDGVRLRGSTGLEVTKDRVALTEGDLSIEAAVDRAKLAPLGLPVSDAVTVDGQAAARLRLSGFERIALEPETDANGEVNSRLSIEGGRVEAAARVSDLVGRFIVP